MLVRSTESGGKTLEIGYESLDEDFIQLAELVVLASTLPGSARAAAVRSRLQLFETPRPPLLGLAPVRWLFSFLLN